jgi:hypothetical protein
MDLSRQTVVKVSRPADILGMLPHRIGFTPTESIVVICLHGSRRRDGLVMRLDLAPEECDAQVSADLTGRAVKAGATGAVLVCYTDVPASESSTLPRRALIEAMLAELAGGGVAVVDAILVHGGRWWSYLCEDTSCCPPEGTVIDSDLTPSAAHYAAESVGQGAVVLADRQALERSIRPPDDRSEADRCRQALEEAADEVIDAVGDVGPAALRTRTLALLRDVVARRAGGAEGASEQEAARIILGLRAKDARDEAATLVLETDPHALIAVLSALARRAPDRDAAPVCTVLAWAAYAAGQGALANVAVERALACEPGYELARLIEQGLAAMIPPADVMRLTREVRQALADAEPDGSA